MARQNRSEALHCRLAHMDLEQRSLVVFHAESLGFNNLPLLSFLYGQGRLLVSPYPETAFTLRMSGDVSPFLHTSLSKTLRRKHQTS